MSEENFEYLKKYFAINGSAAHPETLLLDGFLSKFSSDDERYESLCLILEARQWERENPSPNVRQYIYTTPDDINFEAKRPLDMLDWRAIKGSKPWWLTSPPWLNDQTDDDLIEYYHEVTAENPQGHKRLPLPTIKSHSMSDEKFVFYFKFFEVSKFYKEFLEIFIIQKMNTKICAKFTLL